MRIKRRRIVPLALIAALALSQSAAGSASAADYPVNIVFTNTGPTTIEYGQYWSFPLNCDGAQYYYFIYNNGLATSTITGAPDYQADIYIYTEFGPFNPCNGTVSAGYEVPPLKAGNYSITVGGTYNDGSDTYTAETPTPATLTVEKAKLGVELRVLADPSNGDAALVTAKFTGRFVDEYQSSFFTGAALSPAGIWNITLTDSDGEVAIERSIERAAGDDVLATSFYWDEAEPGEQYTASAVFTPEGASAGNFAITQASDFDYTAPGVQRPTPTSTATFEPDASLPGATGFSLPLWSLIVIVMLIIGLGVLVTILSVRLSRRSTATTGEGAE